MWFVFAFCVRVYGQPPDDAPEPVPFADDRIFNDQPPFLAGVTVDHANFVYREGDRLRIQFMAEREAHLYLIYHQADGQSRLLFPNVSQPDNKVPATQPVVVPDPKQPLRFRIQPPFGVEVLQVLATVQGVPELDALLRGAAFPGRPSLSGRRQSLPLPSGEGRGEGGSSATRPDGLGSPPHDSTSLPTAPAVSQQVLDGVRDRLLQDKTVWTEHRIVLRTEPKAAPAPPPKAARVGLFIGIGKYEHPEFCHTHVELSHSAEVLHELMLERGGLDPAKTKLVLNEQATKANMQQLISRWLPSVSQPGDVVFIYFSGHAGQFDATDPRELDGQDETLAPYGTSYGTDGMPFAARVRRHRETVILDDTLARWLQELSGRQVVLIFDTCHSGGLVPDKGEGGRGRGGERENSVGNALRGVPRGEGGKILPLPPGEGRKPALDLNIFTDEAARIKGISQLNTIVLASCASDEQSLFEGIQNKTMWFTYCLTEAITRPDAPRPLTVQAAFNYARLRMKQLLIEGNAGREQEPTMTDSVLLPVVLNP